jgi:hypothetical protein
VKFVLVTLKTRGQIAKKCSAFANAMTSQIMFHFFRVPMVSIVILLRQMLEVEKCLHSVRRLIAVGFFRAS